MINVLICGISGKMGGNLVSLLKDDNEAKVICGVDLTELDGVKVYKTFENVQEKVDVIIDFSSPKVIKDELEWAIKKGVPVVIASTGFNDEQLQFIEECSKKIAIFKTANFSLGINLLVELVKKAAKTLGENFDIEIVEKHHNQKVDAPSGTALMLADAANEEFKNSKEYLCGRGKNSGKRKSEIGLHAVRGGTIVGEHEVLFIGTDEVITLAHSAQSKKVFAAGSITAAKWLVSHPPGLYTMQNLLNNA